MRVFRVIGRREGYPQLCPQVWNSVRDRRFTDLHDAPGRLRDANPFDACACRGALPSAFCTGGARHTAFRRSAPDVSVQPAGDVSLILRHCGHMADNDKPDWTTTDDDLRTDPDMPEQPDEADGPESLLPTADDTPIGETERTAEEKAVYEAAVPDDEANPGHAVGGSEGTADGQ